MQNTKKHNTICTMQNTQYNMYNAKCKMQNAQYKMPIKLLRFIKGKQRTAA